MTWNRRRIYCAPLRETPQTRRPCLLGVIFAVVVAFDLPVFAATTFTRLVGSSRRGQWIPTGIGASTVASIGLTRLGRGHGFHVEQAGKFEMKFTGEAKASQVR